MGNRLIVGIALVATISSGCMIVRLDDKFTFAERLPNESPIGDDAIVAEPKIERELSQFYFPFVRIDNRRLPHDLVINLYRSTADPMESSIEFAIFESIELVYSSGSHKVLLAPEKTRSQRTFSVAQSKNWATEKTQVRLVAAVDRADSFVLKCSGTAVSRSGDEVPFETRLRYRYDGTDWDWTTLSQEIGSCGGI